MATNVKRHHHQPLPIGLDKHGLAIWHQLSDTQRNTAEEFSTVDEEYYIRFCQMFNLLGTSVAIVQKGGVLSALTPDGKKIWDMLDPDVQLEIFITSAKGNVDPVRKFINDAWFGFSNKRLTLVQIEKGINTLANQTWA
jgi:hypothetical protein